MGCLNKAGAIYLPTLEVKTAEQQLQQQKLKICSLGWLALAEWYLTLPAYRCLVDGVASLLVT